jgi:menaquinone-dependent protoporphyrinogen IX oxidase
MSKGIILYKSYYGATREYALRISEMTGYDTFPVEKAPNLDEYKTIIIGSPFKSYKLVLGDWIVSHQERLVTKNTVLFTTSLAPPDDKTVKLLYFNSLPRHIRKKIKWVPLAGRMLYSKLNLLDKIIINLAFLKIKNPEQKKMMKSDTDNVDLTSCERVVDLLQ